MEGKIKLPVRRTSPVIPTITIEKKLYLEEKFQLGVIVGVLSTVLIIILSLTIIGLIGAIFS